MVRIRDLNWMQLETYLRKDDRIVLPVGSTEQHAYLSLETDNILAERASIEAAEPLGVPVLPVAPYGVTASLHIPEARRCARPRFSQFSHMSSIRCWARRSRGCSS
jgi:creatinine amidohydrolase/Fe(II)-dependent formamide hydrolase-like protein